MSSRPRLLDLFSGAGGCAKDYQRSGFYVVGIDIKPQKRYCGDEFFQGDALEYLAAHGHEFDAIHASPPCQAFSCASRSAGTAHRHPNLIPATRAGMLATGLPYVIENVPGSPVRKDLVLCGSMFGLEVRRHRIFEIEPSPFLLLPECDHSGRIYSVFGNGSGNENRSDRGSVADWKRAMGIDWMIREELSQAIPPKYCEFIGRQLMAVLENRKAGASC